MAGLVARGGRDIDEYRREVLLVALQEFASPATRAELNAYASVFAEASVEIPDLGEVIAAEESAWRSGVLREVWLCPAFRGRDGTPDRTLLTRSDWKVDLRVLTSATDPPSRPLWLVRVFCDLYLVAEDEGLTDLGLLAEQIREKTEATAKFLPRDLDLDDEDLDSDTVETLREAAEDALGAVGIGDRPERERIAALVRSGTEGWRLFGT